MFKHGNTGIHNASLNIAKMLNAAQVNDIPVYAGSEQPLVLTYEHEYLVWVGWDGFGDANLPEVEPKLESMHAVNAIIKMAEEYKEKGKLTILALGPLTNLAMAIRLKPELKNMIKAVQMLGGNHQAVGNVRVAAEFNFYADPEAAFVVLENYPPTPLYISPWETLMSSVSNCTWRKEVLGKIKSTKMELLNAIEANIFKVCDAEGWSAVDAVAASILFNPAVTSKSEMHLTSVELNGRLTRGMMVVDKRMPVQGPMGSGSNVTIHTEINQELYEQILVWAVS